MYMMPGPSFDGEFNTHIRLVMLQFKVQLGDEEEQQA
jgi:hypothetical protein